MKLYSKNDLKDSRIFFDKKPPAFLTGFIISVLGILILSLWIASWLNKPYIIKASGIITTSDNMYVSSLSDGIVATLAVNEGTYVNKGDILLELSNGSDGIQYNAVLTQINDTQSKIDVIDKYVDSLNKAKNNMSNLGIEQEYYEKVRYYLITLEDEKRTKENTHMSLTKKQEKKFLKEQEISNLQNQIDILTDSEEDKIKKEELKSELETKKSEAESLQTEIEELQQSELSQAEQTKIQLISEAISSRTSLQSTLVELQGQLQAYQAQDSLTSIIANNSGYVHYINSIKPGMAIPKGQVIAEISTNEEELMLVEAYIQATDISKVEVGNSVKVEINGVNVQKYSTLNGILISIDSGTVTQETENGNVILYRCLISLDNKQLKATDGTIINAIKSMPVTARIVYEQETYLDWLLEMLSFKN